VALASVAAAAVVAALGGGPGASVAERRGPLVAVGAADA
jgi:hypothetical protein